MKEDELNKYLKTANEQIAKHAEVINTLNKNQQVLVKKIEEFEKTNEINKRVQEIVKQTQASAQAAEQKASTTTEEKKAEPAPAEKPAEEKPATTEEKKEE